MREREREREREKQMREKRRIKKELGVLLMLRLCQWKTLYKDSFAYFFVFGGIKKDELKEKYL